MDAVFTDFAVASVKTGMLSSSEIVAAVSRKLRQHIPQTSGGVLSKRAPIVVDPVMISKSRFPLLKEEAIASLKAELIPLATLITPNVYEAELLAQREIQTNEDAKAAAQAIAALGCEAVLVKGGHLGGALATDVLYFGGEWHFFEAERIDTQNTHGTGCTYSAAIATQLAHGKELTEAICAAKVYITNAIRHALDIGHGHGPTNHFYGIV